MTREEIKEDPARAEILLAAKDARIEALEGRVKDLEAKLEPEIWWPAEWGDAAHEGPEDYMDGLDHDAVGEFWVGCQLGTRWAAWSCVTVDENGDPDEVKVVTFEREYEAMRCWPESLGRARDAMETSDD